MGDVIYAGVSAVLGLGILIVIHELGHFLVAKKAGVGVLTFSVGFGPKLWGRRINETEYVISSFPLGGYVKMVGEDPEEEVKEIDISKSFSHKSLGARAAIVGAGPLFNLLLAAVIFSATFMWVGVPALTTRVGSVEADTPAAKAGLQKGDRILAIDGEGVEKWEELSERIKASGGRRLTLTIEREGRRIDLQVQPVIREGKTVFGERQDVWIIGIASDVEMRKSDPVTALAQGFYRTGEYAVLTVVGLFKMITGTVSPKNIGGPLMIAQVAGQQAQEGLGSFFFFLALLSVNLGVLNLLPIPVLDGGHLFFFLMEWLIGRPVEIKYRERAQQIGIFILILIMMYAFYNDVTRFFEG
ncbi:MAG TPA: RIP metalloprotease RseP [Candidatus Acidoferrales bacterium]|nr:RIP metalloprotease RseP [Candidatus Acidoferrales bacterium]